MTARETIKDTILQGVQEANEEYEEWSNGWWLTDSGVEGLMVATIARRLVSIIAKNESLVMELPFRDIEEWSGASRPDRRPKKTLKGRNRADIVILDRRDRPICVIEAKRLWNRTGCLGDLKRIRNLILASADQPSGSLNFGFLAIMLAKKDWGRNSANNRIQEQAKGITKTVKKEFRLKGLKLEFYTSNPRRFPLKYKERWNQPNWSHSAYCIGLSRTE